MEAQAFLDWWFRPDLYPHSEGDQGLKEWGLYSVDSFLHAWERHITPTTALIEAQLTFY